MNQCTQQTDTLMRPVFQAEGTEISREKIMFEEWRDLDTKVRNYKINIFIIIKNTYCKRIETIK